MRVMVDGNFLVSSKHANELTVKMEERPEGKTQGNITVKNCIWNINNIAVKKWKLCSDATVETRHRETVVTRLHETEGPQAIIGIKTIGICRLILTTIN